MQSTVQEAMPPEFSSAPAPELRPEDHIRLDKTRMTYVRDGTGAQAVSPEGKVIKVQDYSEVYGSERQPHDPWANVAFVQDGLPFDINGELVPDDGKTQPFQGMGPDGKLITYAPLYTKKMRDTVEKKMRRIKAGMKSKTPAPDEDQYEDDTNSPVQINVTDWLMGDAEYPFFLIQHAVKERYSAGLTSVAEIVRFLIIEQKVMKRELVADKFQRYLLA